MNWLLRIGFLLCGLTASSVFSASPDRSGSTLPTERPAITQEPWDHGHDHAILSGTKVDVSAPVVNEKIKSPGLPSGTTRDASYDRFIRAFHIPVDHSPVLSDKTVLRGPPFVSAS